uniref:pantoate--beta-alanine ligase n=1 Tax=Stappia sp. TaxID=1870903 RepID=UPI003BAB11CC
MSAPQVHPTISALREHLAAARAKGARIAMVPTMGALHEGHLSLVRAAREHAEHVVVSIFVNPTQFAPTEDFDAYPRDEQSDLDKLAAEGVESVFMPGRAEMYPEGFATSVSVGGPAEGLESASRPHFFAGVSLVVTKLLLAALPDVAIFGEKDYQQLCVIRRFVRDLNIPVQVLGGETVREPDGLAMSSRNRYLDTATRATAARLPEVLFDTARRLEAGAPPAPLLDQAIASLAASGFDVDYLELREADTLTPLASGTRSARLLVAARLGTTRLIDNVALTLPA